MRDIETPSFPPIEDFTQVQANVRAIPNICEYNINIALDVDSLVGNVTLLAYSNVRIMTGNQQKPNRPYVKPTNQINSE